MPPPLLVGPATLKRLHREIADVKKEDLGAITLVPTEDNLFLWKGTIPGPEGSVYEGGVFHVDVILAVDYPFSAPKVVFKTRIYHMNISDQGNICIDILKHNWSPALSLFKVMLSLSSLLTDPNPKDPLVPGIATQYIRDRKLHDSTARRWTELYARPRPPTPPPPPAPSAKSRGKKRDVEMSRSSRTAVIDIDDSENEEGDPTRRTKCGTGTKRKRGESAAHIDLNDEEEEIEVSEVSSAAKKRAVGATITEITAASGSSGRPARNRQLGDIIVIDD